MAREALTSRGRKEVGDNLQSSPHPQIRTSLSHRGLPRRHGLHVGLDASPVAGATMSAVGRAAARAPALQYNADRPNVSSLTRRSFATLVSQQLFSTGH